MLDNGDGTATLNCSGGSSVTVNTSTAKDATDGCVVGNLAAGADLSGPCLILGQFSGPNFFKANLAKAFAYGDNQIG